MLARERANVIPAADFKEILVNLHTPPVPIFCKGAVFLIMIFLQPNHERNPLEELSALADEEGEQVEEEKEKTPRAAEASRGENCGISAEDLDFGVEEFEEAVAPVLKNVCVPPTSKFWPIVPPPKSA